MTLYHSLYWVTLYHSLYWVILGSGIDSWSG